MQTIRTNLNINASSQYTNHDFNSMFRFNGKIIGCGASGVISIGEGADDNGTDIDAYFIPHKTNFGTLNKKRERYCYLGYESDGDMTVEVTGDDETTIGPYTVSAKSTEGQQRRRVTIGNGMSSGYLLHKFSNVDGADFAIDEIEVALDTKKYGGR